MRNADKPKIILAASLIAISYALLFYQTPASSLSRLPFFASIGEAQLPSQESSLSHEELAALVKPSTVRIVQAITGEAKIPKFKVDLQKLTISQVPGEPETIPFKDTYITGSGFIVNQDGYILTNAHVVSEENIKVITAGVTFLGAMFEDALSLSEEETEKLSDDEDQAVQFAKRSIKTIIEKSTFNIQSKIAVLNPGSGKEKLADLFAEGFPASVVKVNDSYWDDEKDAAIIKIEKSALPSMRLGGSESLSVGKKIFVFGYPSNAEFNNKNFTEATFTQGVVSAIKDSYNKEFKVIQTDAKVSKGSSGGPLFNEKGEAVGLITFQSDPLQEEGGDNFAFAVPIEIAKKMLTDSYIILSQAQDYNTHFLAGLKLQKERKCKKANEEFELAKKTDPSFNVDKYISPYIDKCNAMIASGQSLDSFWDEAMDWLAQIGYLAWLIIGGGLLIFAALVLVLIKLIKRMRNRESQLDELAVRLEKEERNTMAQSGNNIQNGEVKVSYEGFVGADLAKQRNEASQTSVLDEKKPQPQKQAPEPDSNLLKYVKDSRNVGASDDIISEELKKVGWEEADIKNALKT